MTNSSIHDLKSGDKVAIEDCNINDEFFYVEAEVYEVTLGGFLITSEGTFDIADFRIKSHKRLAVIDARIAVEIEKLKLRKYIHGFFNQSLSKMDLEDLKIVRDIVEKYFK